MAVNKTKKYNKINILALLLVGVSGCAGFSQTAGLGKIEISPDIKPSRVIVGKASWYGKRFNGRKTASGEKYDMFSMTAAHRSLPFGTLLRVTNLDNQKQSIVRINDRGPFIRHRVLDLSYAAAKSLGMVDAGVSRVKIEVYPQRPVADILVAESNF